MFFNVSLFFLPKSFFTIINDIISSFIWAGKRPRASRSLLYRDRSAGGLDLPNLIGYYWASNMLYIILVPSNQLVPEWSGLLLLLLVATSFSMQYLSFLPVKSFLQSSCGWNTKNLDTNKKPHLPLATPICNNPLFAPAKTDPRFSALENKGLRSLGDLYVNDIFASFH